MAELPSNVFLAEEFLEYFATWQLHNLRRLGDGMIWPYLTCWGLGWKKNIWENPWENPNPNRWMVVGKSRCSRVILLIRSRKTGCSASGLSFQNDQLSKYAKYHCVLFANPQEPQLVLVMFRIQSSFVPFLTSLIPLFLSCRSSCGHVYVESVILLKPPNWDTEEKLKISGIASNKRWITVQWYKMIEVKLPTVNYIDFSDHFTVNVLTKAMFLPHFSASWIRGRLLHW